MAESAGAAITAVEVVDQFETRLHHRHHSMVNEAFRGYENLEHDHHDKYFGIWRTPAGAHHRIDIVVCATPLDLPFARLAWTGSRTLNRLLRLRAVSLDKESRETVEQIVEESKQKDATLRARDATISEQAAHLVSVQREIERLREELARSCEA